MIIWYLTTPSRGGSARVIAHHGGLAIAPAQQRIPLYWILLGCATLLWRIPSGICKFDQRAGSGRSQHSEPNPDSVETWWPGRRHRDAYGGRGSTSSMRISDSRAEYVLDPCPHCESSKIGSHFAGARAKDTAGGILESLLANTWVCLFVCKKCNHGVVVELSHTDPMNTSSPICCSGDPTEAGFTVLLEYPSYQKNRAPADTPASIAKRFNQGIAVLSASPESAAMLFRKVLETALNHIDPDSKDDRLSDRIKKLCGENKLTPQMGDWASAIRIDGNRAAHGDQVPTAAEVRQTRHFTDVLLQYLFTLPGMIKRHQKANQKQRGRQTK